MQIQIHSFTPSSPIVTNSYLNNGASKTLVGNWNARRNKMLCRRLHSKMVVSSLSRKLNRSISVHGGVWKYNLCSWEKKNRGTLLSASKGQNEVTAKETKREVVEHICLLKAKDDLSDEEEKDMLDYLYTSQYQMGGIIAISLGRISDRNVGNYSHAVFMRFHMKEDLAKFYQNPFYLAVLKDHVMPHCHGILDVDYESQIEDDILPIFRKGEEFNFGLEFVLLVAFAESSLGKSADDALVSLVELTMEFPSLIVQATQGSNFNKNSKEYSHAAVIRFRSSEAFNIFMGSSEYKEIWKIKFQPITQKVLSVYFSVDPVGTEVM